jgi:hypothetical protein
VTQFCKDCLWHRRGDICAHEANDPQGYLVRGEGSAHCSTSRMKWDGTSFSPCGPEGRLFELRSADVPEPTVVDTRSVWQVLRDLWRS